MIVQQLKIRNIGDAVAELVRAGATADAIETAAARAVHRCLRVSGAGAHVAAALRDAMRAAGGHAALSESPGVGRELLLSGNLGDFTLMLARLPESDVELHTCAVEIKRVLIRSEGGAPQPINVRGHSLEWGAKTFVMGILNVTPDSFHAGSRLTDAKAALAAARAMLEAGADILDVGGESSRPGAAPVPAAEELNRVLPAIRAIRSELPGAIISIDTYKSAVAAAALEAGADIINDISALGADENMAHVAAAAGAPVCLMHMQGTPRNMQMNPKYEKDVVGEILEFLQRRIAVAVTAGIAENNIIVDPGIGFGKTVEHNLEIVSRLEEFRSLGRPVLIGASRKSFIGKMLDLPAEADRLEGSLSVAALCIAGGAHVLRVHDVKESVRAARMADAVVRRKRMIEGKE